MSKNKCPSKKEPNIEAACELSPNLSNSGSNSGGGCKSGDSKAKKH